jgi:spore coat polysaccharide biosynthesis protein SpsF
MKIVTIIQARMGSTRLPGKIMMDICGRSMLARVCERVNRAKRIDDLVVAIPNGKTDDALEVYCRAHGWNCFRGSHDDVLDRYYRAAKEFDADAVVRITSDCPLIDYDLVDRVIECYVAKLSDIDYVSNLLPLRTYPRGLDAEIMSFGALERAWKEDNNPRTREHVTQYIVGNPSKFRLTGISNAIDYSYMRWTVDETRDLELVRCVYSHFDEKDFSWMDIAQYLLGRPDLLELNNSVRQKQV